MLEYVVKLSCRVAKHLRQPKEAGHAALTRLALDASYSRSVGTARRLRAPASLWAPLLYPQHPGPLAGRGGCWTLSKSSRMLPGIAGDGEKRIAWKAGLAFCPTWQVDFE